MSGSSHGICLHGEPAFLSTERVSTRCPFNKIKGEENLDDIERMCRERSEGSSSSGRAAIQSRTNEGRRWWQYGGGITLDSLVKHQEQTSVGRIAQRRSKEPAKELGRSGAYDRHHGKCQGTIRMEITLQKDKEMQASSGACGGERAEIVRTSYRALSTEKGFSTKPTATRVVAPARRFPELVSTGRTEECLPDLRFCAAVKMGEAAMKPRT